MEASDINDSTILGNTLLVDGKFTYKLPSGRILSSEPVPEERRKEAVPLWLNTVRAQVVEDVALIRKLQQKKRVEIPSTTSAAPTSSSVSTAAPATSTTAPANLSALEFAQKQVDSLSREVKQLQESLLYITGQEARASKALSEWELIVNQLEEKQDNEPSNVAGV